MDKENIVLVIYINIGDKDIPTGTAYMNRVKKDIEEMRSKQGKFWCALVPAKDDEPEEDDDSEEQEDAPKEN